MVNKNVFLQAGYELRPNQSLTVPFNSVVFILKYYNNLKIFCFWIENSMFELLIRFSSVYPQIHIDILWRTYSPPAVLATRCTFNGVDMVLWPLWPVTHTPPKIALLALFSPSPLLLFYYIYFMFFMILCFCFSRSL